MDFQANEKAVPQPSQNCLNFLGVNAIYPKLAISAIATFFAEAFDYRDHHVGRIGCLALCLFFYFLIKFSFCMKEFANWRTLTLQAKSNDIKNFVDHMNNQGRNVDPTTTSALYARTDFDYIAKGELISTPAAFLIGMLIITVGSSDSILAGMHHFIWNLIL